MTTLDIAGISVAPGTRRRHAIELTEPRRRHAGLDSARPHPRRGARAAALPRRRDSRRRGRRRRHPVPGTRGCGPEAAAGQHRVRAGAAPAFVPRRPPAAHLAVHEVAARPGPGRCVGVLPRSARRQPRPGARRHPVRDGEDLRLSPSTSTPPPGAGRYVPIAILPHPSLGDSHARAEEMAHAFGSGWIMRTDTGFYVADGILCVEATRAGVPAFTFETGEGGRLEEGVIDDGAVYIRNVMKWLKMIDGEPVAPAKTWVMKEFLGLRAQRGGAAAHPGRGSGTSWTRARTCAPSSTSTATRWRPSPRRRAGCSCARPPSRPSRAPSGRRPSACFEPGRRQGASRCARGVAVRGARGSVPDAGAHRQHQSAGRHHGHGRSDRGRARTAGPASSIAGWSAGRRRSIWLRGCEGRAPAAGWC